MSKSKDFSKADLSKFPLTNSFFSWADNCKDGDGRKSFLEYIDYSLLDKYSVDDLPEELEDDFLRLMFYMEQYFKAKKEVLLTEDEVAGKFCLTQWYLRMEKCSRQLTAAAIDILNTHDSLPDHVKDNVKGIIKGPLYSFSNEGPEEGGFKLKITDIVMDRLKVDYPGEREFLDRTRKEFPA